MHINLKGSNEYSYEDRYWTKYTQNPLGEKMNFELIDGTEEVTMIRWNEQKSWAKKALTGEYCLWNEHFRYFELEEDMILFILRWGTN